MFETLTLTQRIKNWWRQRTEARGIYKPLEIGHKDDFLPCALFTKYNYRNRFSQVCWYGHV